MDGRGPSAERSINRLNQLREQLLDSDDSEEKAQPIDRSGYQGEFTTTVPDEFEIVREKSDVSTQEAGIFSDSDRVSSLDVQYNTLFSEAGFEILRELEEGERSFPPGQVGSASYEETLGLLDFHGFVDVEGHVEITEEGETVYNRWNAFREYLSSDERVDAIEDEVGDTSMLEFLEKEGVNVSLHEYLSNPGKAKRAWARNHDQDAEFYEIGQLLYSDGIGDFGRGIVTLADVKQGDIAPPEYFEHAGVRGLIDSTDSLNEEGSRLYSKVLADYVRLQQ